MRGAGKHVVRMRLAVVGLLGAALLPRAFAQAAVASSQSSDSAWVDLAHIEDFSFSYAQRAFYSVLDRVRQTGVAALDEREPLTIIDWKTLLERSADYRGRAVIVEGVVGRNSAWKPLDERQQALGTVWELQLHRDDQPLICKCILVGDAGDIPIGARVTLSGVFVMIQQYYSESKRLRQAALLVGVGPTTVSQATGSKAPQRSDTLTGAIFALLTGLALAWFLLRRHMQADKARDAARAASASRPAPVSLAEDLAAWANEDGASGPPERPERE
jgi:hypothetical protein